MKSVYDLKVEVIVYCVCMFYISGSQMFSVMPSLKMEQVINVSCLHDITDGIVNSRVTAVVVWNV